MLLALDIGNSTIVAVLFERGTIAARTTVPSAIQRSTEETWHIIESLLHQAGVHPNQLRGAGISSGIPFLTDLFSQLCDEKLGFSPLIINGTTNTGMRIRYADPIQLGADRICSAVAAFAKYGGPSVIIDFGTATTFGIVSAEGDFLGGAITLGVQSSAEALARRTPALPSVDLHAPSSLICADTESAIIAGTVYGAAGSVEGMVRRIREELRAEAKVVVTGGMSSLMVEVTDVIGHHEPDLVLDGIRLVWERNHPQHQQPASSVPLRGF